MKDQATNDPRPVGNSDNDEITGGFKQGRKPESQTVNSPDYDEDNVKDSSTNDPRPLGGHGSKREPRALEEGSSPQNTSEREGKLESNVTNARYDTSNDKIDSMHKAKEVAVDALHSAREKAAAAAAAAKERAAGALEYSKQKLGFNDEDAFKDTIGMAQPVEQKVDEVDLSPEEQFTRHRVEMDADKLHALHKTQGRFKVNPVRATPLQQRVVRSFKNNGQGEGHDVGGGGRNMSEDSAFQERAAGMPTVSEVKQKAQAENRGDESAFQERAAAAVASEGESSKQPPPGKEKDWDSSASFPETLGEAITGSSDMSNKPVPSATTAQGLDPDEDGTEPAPPNPFGVTTSQRSKL